MSLPHEQLQHEAIKTLLKQAIQNNPNLTHHQKQMVMNNIDLAAMKADWIVEMMKMCGWLK